jgi:maltose O-acetyltransferase
MAKSNRLLIGMALYAPSSRLKAAFYRAAGVKIGKNVHIAPNVVIRCDEMDKVKIGDNCTFGIGTTIACKFIEIGNDVTIGGGTNIRGEGIVKIGNSASVGIQSVFDSRDSIIIEDGVQLAPSVKILTHDSSVRDTKDGEVIFKKTVLQKKSYIGSGAVLLPGITVGSKAVVGAGAVVTKDVPQKVTVVGNPAKPVKKKGK